MDLCEKSKAFILFYIMFLIVLGEGAVYKVGDSHGWTTIGNIDYEKWASSKLFRVGDSILFQYNPKFHNLIEVNHEDFRSCNAASPMKTHTTGNDTFMIKAPGHYYFLCGYPGHCEAGQKVDIRVLKTYRPSTNIQGSSPSPSPVASVSTTTMMSPEPAPSPNMAAMSVHCSLKLLFTTTLACFLYNNVGHLVLQFILIYVVSLIFFN